MQKHINRGKGSSDVHGRTVYRLLIICIVFCCCALPAIANDWRTEFDDLCSQVPNGTSLSREELLSLIDRTDTLIERLKEMDLESKDIFLFRLKKCRSFFQYMIDLKELETPGT